MTLVPAPMRRSAPLPSATVARAVAADEFNARAAATSASRLAS
jgi:hypothetical protein